MTGNDFYNLRRDLGLSCAEFARALGYTGTARNEQRRIRRLELKDMVPEDVAEKAHGLWLRRGGCGS